MSKLLAKDYVVATIDQDEMKGGKKVAARLRGGKGGGIPWTVIMDGDGKQVITSDSPKGNIGCPVTPDEVAWFMKMLRTTKRNMTDADLEAVGRALEKFAKTFRR